MESELIVKMASAAALPFLFQWADRRVGAGGEKVLGPLGGRSLGFIGGGLVGAALGYAAAGPWGASIGLFWVPYRSLDFKHGAGAPTNQRERRNAVLRHLIAVLSAGLVYLFGGPWILAGVVMLLYANVAATLAFGLGALLIECQKTGEPWNDEWNAKVERTRGLGYGLAMAITCGVGAFI
jgi:hypothetical protein